MKIGEKKQRRIIPDFSLPPIKGEAGEEQREQRLNRRLVGIALMIILIGGIIVYSLLASKDQATEEADTLSNADDARMNNADDPLADDTLNEQGDNRLVVEVGDRVTIDYLTRLEDGTIIDTSNEAYAKKYSIYDQDKQYGGYTITVGKGQVIKGLETGMLGMRLHEQKRIQVTPEDGYGLPDQKKIRQMPRVKEMKRLKELTLAFNATLKEFIDAFKQQPLVGSTVTGRISPWPYRVLGIDGETVRMQAVIAEGKSYALPNTAWNATAVSVTRDRAKLRQDPVQKTVQTELGPATVTVTDDIITLLLSPRIGEVIKTKDGRGVVKALDNTSITIDYNHPLAGMTLVFEVYVERLVKRY